MTRQQDLFSCGTSDRFQREVERDALSGDVWTQSAYRRDEALRFLVNSDVDLDTCMDLPPALVTYITLARQGAAK